MFGVRWIDNGLEKTRYFLNSASRTEFVANLKNFSKVSKIELFLQR